MITIKKTIKSFISQIWRTCALQTWFLPILRFYLRLNIKPFGKNKSASIRILALNSSRYVPDLEILNAHPDLVIYILPHRIQTLINSLFYRDMMHEIDTPDNIHKFAAFHERESSSERKGLVEFLTKILPPLLKSLNIDGLMSCSFFYMADIDWQRACAKANIPFFALHKENMQDGVVHEQMIARYKAMKHRFYGQRLFLYNNLVKVVILGADICDPKAIRVVGAARMDKLFRKLLNGHIAPPKKQVTLFSSHHCIGLLQIKNELNYFSTDGKEGFVEYFDLVHGNIIKFAHDHPNIDVYIKPKWGGNWIDHIKAAGLKMGYDTNNIPNLFITWQKPAQELIEESSVIIGINSTALLESMIVGRPVVLPLFAEASGKYYDKHVYFKKYEDEAFNVVRDPNLLGKAILDELESRTAKREMPKAMIEDYLGYCDDRSTERIVEQMKVDIQEIKG